MTGRLTNSFLGARIGWNVVQNWPARHAQRCDLAQSLGGERGAKLFLQNSKTESHERILTRHRDLLSVLALLLIQFNLAESFLVFFTASNLSEICADGANTLRVKTPSARFRSCSPRCPPPQQFSTFSHFAFAERIASNHAEKREVRLPEQQQPRSLGRKTG